VKGATVKFDGKAATKVSFISTTELAATTPANTTEVRLHVEVTNPASDTAILEDIFVYRAPGTPNVAAVPPVKGMVLLLAGNNDLPALLKAQKFTVSAVYLLDVAKQTWKVYISGAPTIVNTLTALKGDRHRHSAPLSPRHLHRVSGRARLSS